MKKICLISIAILALLSLGCSKDDPEDITADPDKEQQKEENQEEARKLTSINLFLKSSFQVYYYWIDSMQSKLNQWGDTDDPIEAYEKFKHTDDRWGFVSEQAEKIEEALNGVTTSYGYNGIYTTLKDTVVLVVEYVSADTPASKAGIRRGDVFSKFNGQVLLYRNGDDVTEVNANLNKMINEVNSKTSTFTYAFTGKTVTMTPETLYENPILVSKVFDFDGKKVAYLHYTQFELKALEQLVKEFEGYKAEGVSELILDLRYNGGGYVSAEELLASLIAPVANVKKRDLYSKTQYNQYLTKNISDTETYFSPEMTIQDIKYYPASANPDFKKLYVLMTDNTASASELLINGLLPYMDVQIFGQQSYGKTATCILLSGEDWYSSYKNYMSHKQYSDGIKYASNWCGYITVAYNVNALGQAECCPNGFAVDTDKTVRDIPTDGYQLGDPKETMLAKVLEYAGYSQKTKSSVPESGHTEVFGETITSSRKLLFPEWGFAIKELQ